MIRYIEDFVHTWQSESKSTLKLFERLTNASLSVPLVPGYRTIGQLANHLVEIIREMPGEAGLPVKNKFNPAVSVPDLVREYEIASHEMLVALQSHWTDNMLQDVIHLYGREWTKSQFLDSLILHQAHHRGQITVLMRLAGLKVPGLYGPSKEEWEIIRATHKKTEI